MSSDKEDILRRRTLSERSLSQGGANHLSSLSSSTPNLARFSATASKSVPKSLEKERFLELQQAFNNTFKGNAEILVCFNALFKKHSTKRNFYTELNPKLETLLELNAQTQPKAALKAMLALYMFYVSLNSSENKELIAVLKETISEIDKMPDEDFFQLRTAVEALLGTPVSGISVSTKVQYVAKMVKEATLNRRLPEDLMNILKDLKENDLIIADTLIRTIQNGFHDKKLDKGAYNKKLDALAVLLGALKKAGTQEERLDTMAQLLSLYVFLEKDSVEERSEVVADIVKSLEIASKIAEICSSKSGLNSIEKELVSFFESSAHTVQAIKKLNNTIQNINVATWIERVKPKNPKEEQLAKFLMAQFLNADSDVDSSAKRLEALSVLLEEVFATDQKDTRVNATEALISTYFAYFDKADNALISEIAACLNEARRISKSYAKQDFLKDIEDKLWLLLEDAPLSAEKIQSVVDDIRKILQEREKEFNAELVQSLAQDLDTSGNPDLWQPSIQALIETLKKSEQRSNLQNKIYEISARSGCLHDLKQSLIQRETAPSGVINAMMDMLVYRCALVPEVNRPNLDAMKSQVGKILALYQTTGDTVILQELESHLLNCLESVEINQETIDSFTEALENLKQNTQLYLALQPESRAIWNRLKTDLIDDEESQLLDRYIQVLVSQWREVNSTWLDTFMQNIGNAFNPDDPLLALNGLYEVLKLLQKGINHDTLGYRHDQSEMASLLKALRELHDIKPNPLLIECVRNRLLALAKSQPIGDEAMKACVNDVKQDLLSHIETEYQVASESIQTATTTSSERKQEIQSIEVHISAIEKEKDALEGSIKEEARIFDTHVLEKETALKMKHEALAQKGEINSSQKRVLAEQEEKLQEEQQASSKLESELQSVQDGILDLELGCTESLAKIKKNKAALAELDAMNAALVDKKDALQQQYETVLAKGGAIQQYIEDEKSLPDDAKAVYRGIRSLRTSLISDINRIIAEHKHLKTSPSSLTWLFRSKETAVLSRALEDLKQQLTAFGDTAWVTAPQEKQRSEKIAELAQQIKTLKRAIEAALKDKDISEERKATLQSFLNRLEGKTNNVAKAKVTQFSSQDALLERHGYEAKKARVENTTLQRVQTEREEALEEYKTALPNGLLDSLGVEHPDLSFRGITTALQGREEKLKQEKEAILRESPGLQALRELQAKGAALSASMKVSEGQQAVLSKDIQDRRNAVSATEAAIEGVEVEINRDERLLAEEKAAHAAKLKDLNEQKEHLAQEESVKAQDKQALQIEIAGFSAQIEQQQTARKSLAKAAADLGNATFEKNLKREAAALERARLNAEIKAVEVRIGNIEQQLRAKYQVSNTVDKDLVKQYVAERVLLNQCQVALNASSPDVPVSPQLEPTASPGKDAHGQRAKSGRTRVAYIAGPAVAPTKESERLANLQREEKAAMQGTLKRLDSNIAHTIERIGSAQSKELKNSCLLECVAEACELFKKKFEVEAIEKRMLEAPEPNVPPLLPAPEKVRPEYSLNPPQTSGLDSTCGSESRKKPNIFGMFALSSVSSNLSVDPISSNSYERK